MGWGAGPVGQNQYGSGGLADLRLENAQPVRDNVVRLTFNAAPLFTGILNPNDGADPARYGITAVAGSAIDGSTPRTVTPAAVETAGGGGALIDVVTDRPFDPFPGRYIVSVNQLVVADTGGLLEAGFTSVEFDGLRRFIPAPRRDRAVPSRDVANPQTQAALDGTAILQAGQTSVFLGTIPVDETGDYAFDEGLENLKKRITRRLVTVKGRFGHLPSYGVGVTSFLKQLSRASTRAQIASDAEKQIREEPEVEGVKVTVVSDPNTPSLVRFRVRVRSSKLSDEDIDMNIPFAPVEA